MKRLIKKVAARLGAGRETAGRPDDSRVVSLRPDGPSKGNVLLAYILEPFLLAPGEPISNAHTHDWESYEMARTFLELDYAVDVISFRNRHFVPRKRYAVFVSARTHFDVISARLDEDCLRIVHQDTAHWIFNNQAAYTRLLALQRRRGVTLDSVRIVEKNWSMENAHCAVVLGNEFTIDTYRYANKPIYRVPISAPAVYAWPDDKDFGEARTGFLWFGSGGFVHKGLDLVLEAFSRLPELHLTICGPVEQEKRFRQVYHKELYETPNIHTHGWVDVAGEDFRAIAAGCAAVIYPSCSEGGGGCVITCMHAGLIPVVTRESSVDIGDFGILLREPTVEGIMEEVKRIAHLSPEACQTQARRAWEFARMHHTRETFAAAYRETVAQILQDHGAGHRARRLG